MSLEEKIAELLRKYKGSSAKVEHLTNGLWLVTIDDEHKHLFEGSVFNIHEPARVRQEYLYEGWAGVTPPPTPW